MPLEGQRVLSQVSLPEQEVRELIYHFQSYFSFFRKVFITCDFCKYKLYLVMFLISFFLEIDHKIEYPKRYRDNVTGGTNRQILTPNRYDEHPSLFL